MDSSSAATDPETLQKWRDYYQTIGTLPFLTYRPLDQKVRQIRLISVYSGPESSLDISSEHCLPQEECSVQKRAVSFSLLDYRQPLPRFTMEEVSLADNPVYSALSYVWGDAQHKRAIIVDGQIHLVTKNLFSVLVSIEVPTTKIWADAICINQEDDDEKSWQVQQMREIYQQAIYTAAWLGPHTEDCDDLLPHIIYPENSLQDTAAIGDVSFEDRIMSIAEPYYNFSVLPYWRRVWIQQEQHASKNVYFHWGTKSFSREALFRFCLDMHRVSLLGITPAFRSSMTTTAVNMLLESASTEMIQFLFRNSSEKPMLELLSSVTHGSARATDPRDRIYAFLGMVSDAAELAIEVDYKKDWRHVFTDTAVALLKKDGPEVLQLCGISEPTIVDPELPSWVPDLTRDGLLSMRVIFEDFCAGGDSKGVLVFVPGAGEFPDLNISGIRVDVISATSTPNLVREEEAIADQLSKLEKLALKSGDKYGSPQGRASAIWRTPIMDHIIGTQSTTAVGDFTYVKAPSDEILEKVFKHICAGGGLAVGGDNQVEGPTGADAGIELVTAAYIGVLEGIYERKYLVSEGGYLGLGSNAAAPGDLVVLIFGLSMPYLLRPVGESKYRIIGEAYIHGIMWGELLAQSYATEEFTIC